MEKLINDEIESQQDTINKAQKLIYSLSILDQDGIQYLRNQLYKKLYISIPVSMGRGSEKFRKQREEKYKEAQDKIREFDEYFKYQPSELEKNYKSFGIYKNV